MTRNTVGKKRRSRADACPWSSSAGWKALSVQDELLLGAEEDGFAGVEILEDPSSVIDPALLAKLDEAARAQRGEEQNRSESSKRRGTAGKATAAAAGAAAPSHSQQHKKRPANAAADSTAGVAALDAEDSGAATAQLQARLRKLEAENRALKKQQQKQQKKQSTTTSDAAAPAEGSQQQQQQQQQQKKKKTDGEKEPHNQEQQEGVAHKTRRERKAEAAAARREQTRARLRALREARKASKQAAQNERAAAAATAAGAGAAAQGGSDGVAGTARPPAVMAAADMSAWDRFSLHPALLTALAARGFSTPTPIQEAVLLPASRDRRDIIGAAATGSGKTLAFGLPILQQLLTERETAAGTAAAAAGSGSRHDRQDTGSGSVNNTALRALILAPTRELALQVCEHLSALGRCVDLRVASVVGGIAPVKQERLLAARPAVVVATPGRLWDLMRNGQRHVNNLASLSFFVLDEADRMVQQGHYAELSHILDMLPTRRRAEVAAAAADAEAAEAAALDSAAAETRAQLRRRNHQLRTPRNGSSEADDGSDGGGGDDDDDGAADELHEEEGDSGDDMDSGGDDDDDSGGDSMDAAAAAAAAADDDGGDDGSENHTDAAAAAAAGDSGMVATVPSRPKRHLLQIMVFSATLTLPAALHKRLRRGGGGSSGAASLESLMDRVPFRPRPAIIDLSPSTRLSTRVTEGVLEAPDGERDALLYYVLARHPGRALVFVNAVSAVRRLAALLRLLGLPATALHAQQQQRQRLRALDRFRSHPHGVLVATDVAARGLDIPDVQIVVHHQLPASADTYIHRSGRTGRTGGSDGAVLSLVSPGDAGRWAALRRALDGQPTPPTFPVDDRVLRSAKQRVAVATKIDAIERDDRKKHAAATWARTNAEAAGIDLSDDSDTLRDTGGVMAAAAMAGRKRRRGSRAAAVEQQTAADDSQAAAAAARSAGALAGVLAGLRRELTAALAVPLAPGINSKFFTGGASHLAAAAATASAPAAAAARSVDDAAGAAAPHSVLPADAVAQTVALAARISASRHGEVAAAGGTGAALAPTRKQAQAAAAPHRRRNSNSSNTADMIAADAARARRTAAALAAAAASGDAAASAMLLTKQQRRGGGAAKRGGKGGVGASTALSRLLMSGNERKRQKAHRGGMVVVRSGAATDGAFGRDALGVPALALLRGTHSTSGAP